MDIAVIGSNMVDLIAYITRMPAEGETIEAPDFKMGCGGKGANQAIAAARLGADVLMLTRVGNDIFALRIDQIFTIKTIFSCCGITAEANTCCRGFAHISKYHSHNVDRCTPFCRNLLTHNPKLNIGQKYLLFIYNTPLYLFKS